MSIRYSPVVMGPVFYHVSHINRQNSEFEFKISPQNRAFLYSLSLFILSLYQKNERR